MTAQLTMTGDDWISDRDRTRQKKAIEARRAAGLKAAKALKKAAEALQDYLRACRECQDGSDDSKMGAGDGRQVLIGNMTEYMGWLYWKHDAERGAA